MNNYYIYKFHYQKRDKENDCDNTVSCTVIFCDREIIDPKNIEAEITKYYSDNHQTDEVYVIGCNTIIPSLNKIFIDEQNSTFKGIPKRQEISLSENFYLLTYDQNGDITCHNQPQIPKGFSEIYLNEGLQNIFIKRGGLINSSGSHHYVFPSGKHCESFLRAGNVLLVSSEIYFIAFSLLKHFDHTIHTQIYCDTSSINSVAFAIVELKNRFLEPDKRVQVPIESFSSYDGLYSKEFSYVESAFLLISASTSTNILAYILDKHRNVKRKNIVVLFYLGDPKNISNIEDKLLCNLTQSEINPNGLTQIKTYKEDNCEYCKEGSHPISVSGDVFLLENPKINRIVFKKTDAEKYLSDLVNQFKSVKKSDTIFKVNYKENLNSTDHDKYEIYIDFEEILKGVNAGKFEKFSGKLNAHIDQYVPSNLKYILYLNDVGSEELAKYILQKVSSNYNTGSMPKIISQENISAHLQKNDVGAILVVGSCIAKGKNLLYISRALRLFEHLKIVYFIGFSRTRNATFHQQLKSNLTQGIYGKETNSFIEIQSIYCTDSKKSNWIREIEFLKVMIDDLKDDEASFSSELKFFEDRRDMLEKSMGKGNKGLSNSLFYPMFTGTTKTELNIRKNFAFFNFYKYDTHVSQSDIYFTISSVIHCLRSSNSTDRNLKQSAYTRNLIDPANFSRFNDGIIQASILRAAKPEELAYKMDLVLSEEMTETLETLIKYHKDEQGEALLEFLYAISIKKLTLKKQHLNKIYELLLEQCEHPIFKCFAKYINEYVIKEIVPEIRKEEVEELPIESETEPD